MNRQERDDLLQFLRLLTFNRATDKDVVAEGLILEHCGRQPDALYLLVQRAMALQVALEAAQARIAQLQSHDPTSQEPQSPARETSAPQDPPDARNGAWRRGLLSQLSTVGLGVGVGVGAGLGLAAGVVAGGLLMDALEGGLGDDF